MSFNSKQQGASTVEYLVGTMAIVAALFTPIINGRSPIELLIDAIKTNYFGYAWAMSVPI